MAPLPWLLASLSLLATFCAFLLLLHTATPLSLLFLVIGKEGNDDGFGAVAGAPAQGQPRRRQAPRPRHPRRPLLPPPLLPLRRVASRAGVAFRRGRERGIGGIYGDRCPRSWRRQRRWETFFFFLFSSPTSF